ncbi:MAG: SRPBCC family protein [Acidimicrobiia bacterium]
MPSSTFAATATAAVPVGEVWAALDEPDTWASIGGVDRVFEPTIDAGGRLQGFKFESVAGGRRYVGTATPRERDEGRLMAWDIVNSEVRGVTRVELASGGASTAITVTLEVESASMMSGLFFPVIAGVIGNGLPEAVAEFAATFSG